MRDVENQTVVSIVKNTVIGAYGMKGYKSIMDILRQESGKSEIEILTDVNQFEKLTKKIFGREGERKITEPIEFEINKRGLRIPKTQDLGKQSKTRLLIADDDPHLLELYKEWLKFDGREITTVTDGEKCLDIYKKEYKYAESNDQENYFDIVILDQIMPKMTGTQVASEILKINPNQRIIFASGYIQEILSESIRKTNKAFEIIKKPFSIEALDDMINEKTLFDRLEQVNQEQKNNTVLEKYSQALTIITDYYKK